MPLLTLEGGPRVDSAGFVLSAERLLTVRFAPSLAFEAYTTRIPSGGVPHRSGAHILIGLPGAIIGQQADAMERIRAEFDKILHRIFAPAGTDRCDRHSFGAVCAIPGFRENSSNQAVSFGCPGRQGSAA